jgi:hypothetical protein
MSGNRSLVKLKIVVPKDVLNNDFDVDEARVVVEEAVEAIVKRTMRIDDSDPCEPASTTIYRTTEAFAMRCDFCLGRLSDGSHLHAKEEYGGNMNEYWYSVEVFAEAGRGRDSGR